MNVTQNFLSRRERNPKWCSTCLSLLCVSSGEASIPKFGLSSTSDEAGVAAMCSPELKVEPMLAFLDGNSIVVTSELLTSAGSMAS